MRRKIKRRMRFEGIRVLYTLTLRDGGRPAEIRLLASGRVKERRAKIVGIPYGKAAAIGFFRKIVRGRVTPCGVFDAYEDFLYDMEYKRRNCKENISKNREEAEAVE